MSIEMAGTYRITVKGHLDDRWSEWFDGLEIRHTPGGESILIGPVADQAALYGILAKLRDLNLPLLALRGPGGSPAG